MNLLKINIYMIILITLMVAGISGCQNSPPENSSQTDREIKTDVQPDNSAVAKLVTSMDMHYFNEPVIAPEFELASVKGGKVSLSQYRGNVILLSFWATW